jgi:hypothetical protein
LSAGRTTGYGPEAALVRRASHRLNAVIIGYFAHLPIFASFSDTSIYVLAPLVRHEVACQLKVLPAVVTEREPVAPLASPTPTIVEPLQIGVLSLPIRFLVSRQDSGHPHYAIVVVRGKDNAVAPHTFTIAFLVVERYLFQTISGYEPAPGYR